MNVRLAARKSGFVRLSAAFRPPFGRLSSAFRHALVWLAAWLGRPLAALPRCLVRVPYPRRRGGGERLSSPFHLPPSPSLSHVVATIGCAFGCSLVHPVRLQEVVVHIRDLQGYRTEEDRAVMIEPWEARLATSDPEEARGRAESALSRYERASSPSGARMLAACAEAVMGDMPGYVARAAAALMRVAEEGKGRNSIIAAKVLMTWPMQLMRAQAEALAAERAAGVPNSVHLHAHGGGGGVVEAELEEMRRGKDGASEGT